MIKSTTGKGEGQRRDFERLEGGSRRKLRMNEGTCRLRALKWQMWTKIETVCMSSTLEKRGTFC